MPQTEFLLQFQENQKSLFEELSQLTKQGFERFIQEEYP
jgi:hypothetical protein